MKDIEQLLDQVQLIINSYERVNEVNRENFNIFSILKLETDEVRTHSRFIAEMLNPVGVHGFKDEFLKIFIKTIGLKIDLNTKGCKVQAEYYTGKINRTKTEGGSIDILVQEGLSAENVIMIENKIYAGEQQNQLLRYSEVFPKGKLLYLTLNGDDSLQKTAEGKYIPISYQSDIINWLEKCKEKSVDHPTLRETIKQYIQLIKKLTNQNINKEMDKELVKLFTKNEENFNSLIKINSLNNAIKQQTIINKVVPVLKELKIEFEREEEGEFEIYEEDLINSSDKYIVLLSFKNKILIEKNLNILFEFQQKNHNGLIGGFVYDNIKNKKEGLNANISKSFKQKFRVPVNKSDYWPFYFDYWHFMNWTNNINDMRNILFGHSVAGDFKEDLRSKIHTLLQLIENKD